VSFRAFRERFHARFCCSSPNLDGQADECSARDRAEKLVLKNYVLDLFFKKTFKTLKV